MQKKFINRPSECVQDSLRGLVASDTRLAFHAHNPRIILRNDLTNAKDGLVTLAAGGGSGHEPFAAGFVGTNGLSAAICGDVFASPPSSHVSDALEAIQSKGGTVLFVINYTGDRLNFGMALERLKASNPHAKLALIYVDDDVALESKQDITVGGRGLAGAVLVLHIAGVLAEAKHATFEQIETRSRRVVENLATFGVSLYPCALPGQSRMFELSADEMELGLGIHGEPGLERTRVTQARDVVGIVMQNLLPSRRLSVTSEEPLAVLVNNLGSVSRLEMNIIHGEVLRYLRDKGHTVVRFYTGTLMTSIDGHGFSVTLLKIVDQDWLDLLDTPSCISALWKGSVPHAAKVPLPSVTQRKDKRDMLNGAAISDEKASLLHKCIRHACDVIAQNEAELNRLDRACGDGDCGTSLKTAANAILKAASENKLAFHRPMTLCSQLSNIFEDVVGGTSGALYALFFGAGAKAFALTFDATTIKESLKLGTEAVMNYGHAKPGHRTLVDPLHAATSADPTSSWGNIVSTVEKAADATATMEAKSGRASYTSSQQQRAPDPGAKAVALWFRAAFDACNPM